MSNFTTSMKNCMSVIKTALSKKADKDYVSVTNGNIKVGSTTIKIASNFQASSSGIVNLVDAAKSVIATLDLRRLVGLRSVVYSISAYTVTNNKYTYSATNDTDLIALNLGTTSDLTLDFSNVSTTSNKVFTIIVKNPSSTDIGLSIVNTSSLSQCLLFDMSTFKIPATKAAIFTVCTAFDLLIISASAQTN